MQEQRERFKLIAASYLFFIKDNQILLIRRANTVYEDGNYSVPAGHLDGQETLKTCAAREGLEEVGCQIRPDDLMLAHVMHRIAKDERLDFFFAVRQWDEEPNNTEPEKCDHLSWFPLDALPENTIPYIKSAIENYKQGIVYSEFGWVKPQQV